MGRLASDLAAHPGLSLASVYAGDWAGLKAGYRFFDNPKVTPAQLLAPHRAATWERAAAEGTVLVAQDTTYFNFTTHPETTGLRPIGAGTEQGFLLHSALALTPAGVAHDASVVGTMTIPVPRKPDHPEREATLELRTTVV